MIRNYFTIAVRNIRRNISYTLINVFGLALGITCSLVLFLMIRFSTSFDKNHDNGDRIYRLVTSSNNRGREDFFMGIPIPLADVVKNEMTGIEKVLLISRSEGGIISIETNGDRKLFDEETGIAFTDSTYFQFFERKIIKGNRYTALTAPNSVILSESFAKKYFGDDDPIGKTIRQNNSRDFYVTAVMEDFPDNTNFPFDMIASYATIKESKEQQGWNSVYSDDQLYVMLKAGTQAQTIDSQFPAIIEKYQPDGRQNGLKRWLQPLSDLNHDRRFSNYRYRSVGYETIWAMGVVAFFLIITACINFVNLSTAVAVRRSREVGIRKVLGSQRLQLVVQFLSETAVITLFSVLLSIGMAELALIKLNSFLGLNLHVSMNDYSTVVYLVSAWVLVSLSAGFYPAMLLSGFSPALALKNKITNRSAGGFVLRRGLVVFQFVISQVLVVGTIILLTQMKFIHDKDLGFTKEAVMLVFMPEESNINKKVAVKTEVDRLPGVKNSSLCFTPPSSGSVSATGFRIDGKDENYVTQVKMFDGNYLDVFELELVAGRGIESNDSSLAWLVNEKLVKVVGYDKPEDILGRNIRMWGRTHPVVGVVKDFHALSLEQEIDPIVMFNQIEDYQYLALKIEPGQVNVTKDAVQKIWEAQYPDFLFDYQFLDEAIANFYESEEKMSVMLAVFSAIAIIIGCLGLYGLISFLANEKEKEIGVRKVLGASTGQILYIFSKEFVLLIVIAFMIAGPLAGYAMSKWLENYVYRVPLHWLMFTAGIGLTLLIAFVTVGYRSFRAAVTNPVNVLRTE
ncbi:MAG: ABC transporter permease [Cyclobacteriaceae bacterium]